MGRRGKKVKVDGLEGLSIYVCLMVWGNFFVVKSI